MDTEHTEETQDARADERKQYVDAIISRLRRQYADRVPFSEDDPKALSLAQLQRLYRHVLSEGYGE